AAGALAAYYKLPLHRVVVAYDDTDLPCGVLRLQPKGGYGRHNGSVKITFMCFVKEFYLRVKRIGRPPGQMDPKAFVLQKFNKTGRERDKCDQTVRTTTPLAIQRNSVLMTLIYFS
uniref:Peptidyl-tRNA hydrolase n=1 Tax=Aegilops tauschii subsp. strangulata TaxID=200361 RepID=A0A453DE14_AEGTS